MAENIMSATAASEMNLKPVDIFLQKVAANIPSAMAEGPLALCIIHVAAELGFLDALLMYCMIYHGSGGGVTSQAAILKDMVDVNPFIEGLL